MSFYKVINGKCFKFFNRGQSGEQILLSRMRNHEKALWSMAQIGDLHKIKKQDLVPVYMGGEEIDRVHIPDELYSLLPVTFKVIVWYWAEAEVGKDSAFKVTLYGDFPVHSIRFDWGLTSGIVSLVFEGYYNYKCSIPRGFNISDLVSLIQSNGIEQFIIDNCKLSRGKIAWIKRNGV